MSTGYGTWSKRMIDGELLSGSPTDTAFLSDSHSFDELKLDVDLTWAAATHVLVKVEVSNDNSTFRRIQSRSISGGVATNTDFEDLIATGGTDENNVLAYDIDGYAYVKVTLTDNATATATTDTVTVTGNFMRRAR